MDVCMYAWILLQHSTNVTTNNRPPATRVLPGAQLRRRRPPAANMIVSCSVYRSVLLCLSCLYVIYSSAILFGYMLYDCFICAPARSRPERSGITFVGSWLGGRTRITCVYIYIYIYIHTYIYICIQIERER